MITRYLTRNPCYRLGRTIRVRGLMLHSVGTAQPDPLVFIRQFDRPDYDRACVHGFIGPKETYVTLPILEIPGSAMRGWHGGKTASNDAYLGIEMTEPDTIRYTDGASFQVLDREATIAHVRQVLDRAEDLFAQLCRFHGLDPLADGIILSHAEGGRRGITTNHADPDHLWAGLGLDYSMDRFHRNVVARLAQPSKEEDLDMTLEEFLDQLTDQQAYQLMQKAHRHAATLPEPDWSRTEGGWAAATALGLTDGTAPERPAKRVEVAAMLHRLGLLE